MRYAKRQNDDTDWTLDEERAVERLMRVRRREATLSPRVTRRMAKIGAELLDLARREDPRASIFPTSPPPRGRAAAAPPPLSIPFPFPFANTASTTMPSLAVINAERRDSFVAVHDSWLLPPLPSKMPALPAVGTCCSLHPRESDPFTTAPPAFSRPPR